VWNKKLAKSNNNNNNNDNDDDDDDDDDDNNNNEMYPSKIILPKQIYKSLVIYTVLFNAL